MNKIFQSAKKTAKELKDGLDEIAIASFEQRAEGLKKAVEEGWFKKFLAGAGVFGVGLAYIGSSNNNDFVAGAGYGVLAMCGIYSLGYVIPALRKLRKKNNRENTEEESK